MRGFVLAHEKERFFSISFFEPIECLISYDVSRVAHMINILAVGEKHGVVILALSLQDFEMLESGRGGFEMPFANNGSLVSHLVQ